VSDYLAHLCWWARELPTCWWAWELTHLDNMKASGVRGGGGSADRPQVRNRPPELIARSKRMEEHWPEPKNVAP
jgi:hypothetical protein